MKALPFVIAPSLAVALATAFVGCGRKPTSTAGEAKVAERASNNAAAASSRDAFERRYGAVAGPEVFGPYWDSVPAPASTGTNGMDSITSFLATNGWSMSTGVLFTYGLTQTKPLHGLPWPELTNREFPAATSGGILYVVLESFHHIATGVAYNPGTNRFADTITGFKPVGAH